MKSFDLEAAKSGAPIVTRDGREARFIAHVPEIDEGQRLLVLIDGNSHITSYHDTGVSPSFIEDWDLVMKPQKRVKYANLYEYASQPRWGLYKTEEEAKKVSGQTLGIRYIAVAVPIEIEE